MSSPKIAFIAKDPTENNTTNQTTWALMQAAQNQGYPIFWMEPSDLHLHHNTPVGYMSPIQVEGGETPTLQMGESFLAPLSRLDVVWWRQAPPYEFEQLFAMDLLQALTGQVNLINNPSTLRSFHPHLLAVQFPNLFPPTLVTKSTSAVDAFLAEVGGKATIRPLHQPSLQKSFFLRHGDPNLSALVEALTQGGSSYVLLQQLVTEANPNGDKRLYLLQGELLGAALQVPGKGEFRGRFERGATAATADINEHDMAIIQQIGPMLKEHDVFFATLDVANGLIIDLNLTAPTGLTQLQSIANTDIISPIFQELQKRL